LPEMGGGAGSRSWSEGLAVSEPGSRAWGWVGSPELGRERNVGWEPECTRAGLVRRWSSRLRMAVSREP
jgi:hypothetical protein